MKKSILVAAFFSLNYVGLSAQETLTNQSVIAMKNAGLSEGLIRTKVETEQGSFDLSTNGILELKKAGFSDEIIQTMMRRAKDMRNETADLSEFPIFGTIENKGDYLLLTGGKKIAKGTDLKVFLPAEGQDFLFIKPKTSPLNAKLIGKIADSAGGLAGAVGLGSTNYKTVSAATKVMRNATAVSYGADALAKVQELPISNTAKKIAGKTATVESWKIINDDYITEVLIEGKKYTVDLQGALALGELKLTTP